MTGGSNLKCGDIPNPSLYHFTNSRHGINLFVDKYEQRGKDLENLFERIKESRIALAIFSTRQVSLVITSGTSKASSGDQIKKWKEALECISGKMGLSLKDESSEADFVKEIVKEVVRVVAAARLKEVETRFEKKRRNDCNCPCQLPVIKRTKTEKL
ncbi:hypothetical protein DY000_02025096 [Brassica cretica]|uniref:TIR domain-containing protein n=1 Tax=Brassica cretica TaxID=69181 RepID=A0ABQ7EET9_BRACR|nr:hypothetical protein DY000_02025096 [Brassica cretica]